MKKLLALAVMAAMVMMTALTASAQPEESDAAAPGAGQTGEEAVPPAAGGGQPGGKTLAELWAEAEEAHQAQVEAAKKYAYMDLETAPPELREKILEARNIIIFSKSWVADGLEMFIIRAGGTVEKVPQFSELFPGWDPPVYETTTDTAEGARPLPLPSPPPLRADTTNGFIVYLDNPPPNTNSTPFYTFYHDGSFVSTYVNTLTSSQTCNIGYSDVSTGESVGFLTNLLPGDSYTLYTTFMPAFHCGVRASTFSNPGYAYLTVSHDSSMQAK